jgi:hypothetical protein
MAKPEISQKQVGNAKSEMGQKQSEAGQKLLFFRVVPVALPRLQGRLQLPASEASEC